LLKRIRVVLTVEQSCGLFKRSAFGFDNVPENKDELEEKPTTVHQRIPYKYDVRSETKTKEKMLTSIR
jgi:hypothetical protein